MGRHVYCEKEEVKVIDLESGDETKGVVKKIWPGTIVVKMENSRPRLFQAADGSDTGMPKKFKIMPC